jgi:hypothetical protein
LKSWSRLDWFILLILAGLVALFFWRIITPNLADRQSFPPGDFYLQFWAFTTFDVRELSAGRLPLWNPYAFAGSPFWADVQAAVFYPFSLVTLILSAPWSFSAFALTIEAIAHFWLATVFMYLFMRAATRSRAAAVIAALTFTFSGYLTGYPSQQLAVLEAAVWLPLILFFLHRAIQPEVAGDIRATYKSAIFYLLLAGLAWGMTLLAGHPQSAFIVAGISCAYLAFLLFWAGDQRPETTPPLLRESSSPDKPHLAHHILQFMLPALFFLLTGLGLAAIQFVPAVEYTLLSVRAEGTYDKMAGGFPLIDIIQFLLPGQVSHYSPLYVGVISLILAICAVVSAKNRHPIFWGVLAFITLLISFGGNTFLYTPLYLAVPGFSIFRGQERWALAVAFSLSVLAGYGFKAYVAANRTPQIEDRGSTQRVSRFPDHVLRLTQYLFLFALALVFLFFVGLNQTGWTPTSPFYGLLGAATLLIILLALAWLLARFSAHLPLPLFSPLTAALICFDLFTVNWQTNLFPQPPAWHTQMPAVVAAIKKDVAQLPGQPFRVYNEFRLYDNYGIPFELEDLWGASPLRPLRYDQFLAPPMPIERTWELLNVKYVITWRQKLYAPSTIIYQEPAEKDTTYVHRLNQVGPRGWLVTQADIADDATILRQIADPNFDRWNIALLEAAREWPPGELTDNPPPAPRHQQPAPRFTFPSPGSLSVQVASETPALLILSEIFYPGWQASLDGQPAPILRAFYTLRAVPVPPGEHTVTLSFQPLSFTIGAIISAITLVTVMVALLWLKRSGV